jgi:ATP-binding cassette subfamily B protein
LQPPPNRAARLKHVPRLVVDALAIVWAAAPRQLVATVVLQTAAAVGITAQLLVSREILHGLVDVGNGGDISSIYPWFAALAVMAAVLAALSAFSTYHQRLLTELTARHAFDSIITVTEAVDYATFEEPGFYDQLQRARNSGMYRTIDMVNNLTTLTMSLITTISIGVVVALLAPELLAFVAIAAIFPLAAAIHNGRQSHSFDYAMTPESRERLYVMEMLTERGPAKEIRVFDAVPYLRARWDALSDERLRRVHIFLRGRLRVSLLAGSAGSLAMAISLGALVFLLATDRLPVAGALTAALAMQQLSSRLNALTTSVGGLIEAGMFVDDYRSFLELAPTPRQRSQSTERRPFAGIRLENVSFSYRGSSRRALEDVTLEIEPGEIVALVGENGSGKTTLVKLICQLYRPSSGRVLWGDSDATTLAPELVQDEITVLFQDYVQYYLSAFDNIVIGRPREADDREAVYEAVQRAGAQRLIDELPQGLDTRLGLQFYGGHELSVGQWQRLALARAFFRGGDFLVLDEPTASLDPRAEFELFEQMRQLAGGRSVLLVSHRFSSVRSADRIYVLERGLVTETGSHDDLVAAEGTYAELFAMQAKAYHLGVA